MGWHCDDVKQRAGGAAYEPLLDRHKFPGTCFEHLLSHHSAHQRAERSHEATKKLGEEARYKRLDNGITSYLHVIEKRFRKLSSLSSAVT